MKKREESALGFGFNVIWWGLLLVFIHRNLLFRCLPGMTRAASDRVFWWIWGVCVLLGLVLTPGRKRTALAALTVAGTPTAIYFLLSCRDLYPDLVGWIGRGILLLAAGYSLLVLVNCWPDMLSGRFGERKNRFLRGYLHQLRMIAGGILTAVLIAQIASQMVGGALMKPNVEAVDPRERSQKIADNIDTVLLLQEDTWSGLSTQERLDVLQTVANIEATYLGLPHELNVSVEALGEDICGHYNDGCHDIVLDADHLVSGSAWDLVDTIAHEAYHAYEHRLVDLYDSTDPEDRELLLFYPVAGYKAEFEDYISSEEDLDAYFEQSVERDSESYAAESVWDYYMAIEEHMTTAE